MSETNFADSGRNASRPIVELRRIEEQRDGHTAVLVYSIDENNTLTIWHTNVPPAVQHSGIGGQLVVKAFDMANELGKSLKIVCPFAQSFWRRHPEIRESNKAAREAVLAPTPTEAVNVSSE